MADEVIAIPIKLVPEVDEAALKQQREKVLKAFGDLTATMGINAKTGSIDQQFKAFAQQVNSPANHQLMQSYLGSHPQAQQATTAYNQYVNNGPKSVQGSGQQQQTSGQTTLAQVQARDPQVRAYQAQETQNQKLKLKQFQDEMNQRRTMLSAEKDVRTQLTRALSLGSAFLSGGMGSRDVSLGMASMGIGLLAKAAAPAMLSLRGGGTAASPVTQASQLASTVTSTIKAVSNAKTIVGSGGVAAAENSSVGGLSTPVAGEGGIGAIGVAGLSVLSLAAIAGGAFIAVNKMKAYTQQQQYQLGAAIPGSENTGYGAPQEPMKQALALSTAMMIPHEKVLDALKTGGELGVGSSDRMPLVQNTLALSQLTGMDSNKAEALGAAMIVQGRLTTSETGKVFDMVVRGSGRVGISMTEMANTLVDFAQATGNQALTVHGYASLMAGQAYFGAKMPMGAIVAPLANATGTQAMRAAQMMGMSPGQFHSMQQGSPTEMALAWGDRLRGLLGPLSKNPDTQATQLTRAEQLTTDNGMLGLSGLSAHMQEKLLTAAMDPTGRAKVADLEKVIQSNTTEQDLQKFAKQFGNVTTDDISKLQLEAENKILGKVIDTNTNLSNIFGAFATLPQNIAMALKNLITGVIPNISLPSLPSVPDAPSFIQGLENAIPNMLKNLGIFGGGDNSQGNYAWTAASGVNAGVNPYTGQQVVPGSAPSTGMGTGGSGYQVPGYGLLSGAQAASFTNAAQKYGVDARTLVSIGKQESRFDPTAYNPSGAAGEMQLMPGTIKAILAQDSGSPFAGFSETLDRSGKVGKNQFDPYNSDQSIQAGAWWLSQKMKGGQYGGGGVAGYGEGAAYATQIADRASQIQVVVTGEIKTPNGTVPVTGHAKHTPVGKPVPPKH